MTNTKATAIPDGYHTVTPFLAVRGGADAIAFYERAFGAEEVMRMPGADGKVLHAEIRIGDSRIMLGDEEPNMDAPSPQTLGGSTGGLMIYCEDVDALFERAVKAGAEVNMPPTDMFWGDRYARLKDPFGHRWAVATHTQDMTPEEMAKGQEEWLKSMTQA